MPALTELSFKVNRTFICGQCHKRWTYSVYLPKTEGDGDGLTSVRSSLRKSLHAAAVAMYGNIGLADLDLTSLQELLEKRVKDCQGEQILKCKTDPKKNTCPNCLYEAKNLQSRDSCCISDILKPSLRSRMTGADQPQSERYQLNFTITEVEELDENANAKVAATTSSPKPAAQRSLSSPSSTMIPEELGPQHGVSLSTYLLMGRRNGEESMVTIDISSTQTLQTTLPSTRPLPPPPENDYEIPVPTLPRPSLPPIPDKLHIFNHRTCSTQIRSALHHYEQFTPLTNMYAILELSYTTSGKMETPYLLMSNRLENTYRTVFQKPTGEYWIHRGSYFNSMRELLSYYHMTPTKSGVLLQTPLTYSLLKSFVALQPAMR